MTDHTPAPWMIEDYGDDDSPVLVIHRGKTENRICFMATPGSQGDLAMIEADALLIAAAPLMLAALEKILEASDNDLFVDATVAVHRIEAALVDCREAVAQATDEANGDRVRRINAKFLS